MFWETEEGKLINLDNVTGIAVPEIFLDDKECAYVYVTGDDCRFRVSIEEFENLKRTLKSINQCIKY